MERHRNDPCWEEGKYTVCHKKIRKNINAKDKIIDVVTVIDDATKKRKAIVRSAFVVNSTEGIGFDKKLFFTKFFFAGEKPIELPDPYKQYTAMKMETFYKKYPNRSQLWDEITQKYNPAYPSGKRPSTIKQQEWDDMIAKRKEREGKNECHTC